METDLQHGQDRPVKAGRVLCRAEDIADGQAKGFYLGEGPAARALFVVRDGSKLHGYVNACPHLGTPLEFRPDRFISADGKHILCSTHGALFEIDGGYCVSGPCAGKRLTPVRVAIDAAERIVLAEALPAALAYPHHK
jgi:nitrite reductase/ring-hydroxylating ferredoxin subunit